VQKALVRAARDGGGEGPFLHGTVELAVRRLLS
jgi:hypothetical protein